MLEPDSQVGVSGGGLKDPVFAVVEVIEALSSARTIEQIADVVRTRARALSGADGVTFVLREDEECVYLDEDAIAPLWKGRRFPMSACISGWAMLSGQTAVIPDIYDDARVPHDAYHPTFVRSLVMTPVRPADAIAAIGAYWSQPHAPSDEVVTLLQVIARATATALANVQAYASLHEALERRKLLVSELDHRCKNTLAAVRSIADQTLRRSASPEHFVEAFNGRIGALSRAHELLTRGDWGHAGLAEVVGQALTPFCGVGGLRLAVSGPQVGLAPETAVAMHMTVHELAVNATKYGALSVDAGRLDVSWELDRREAPGTLEFLWIERGGPRVEAPRARGFGSRLIEQGVARELGGEAQIVFDPEGVQFRLRAPLSPRVAAA